ncbi:MAG: DUF2071 domain-containing protein [Candidatus Obscuribacterales bacterium]|nr:DUF2071 domain-containing protein [Candidatus Obscuribacterales bacterium]
MSQNWVNLLFAHWKIPVETLRTHVPRQLQIDLYEGEAYVGVVPFRMSRVKLRGLPTVEYLSEFLELNVRTYVTVDGRPGVYFFSLDASNDVAVQIARTWYHLPYFKAQMKLTEQITTTGAANDWIEYCSTRQNNKGLNNFKASYRPITPIELSKPSSIEAFLTERYCLYVLDSKDRVCRGDIHHRQWQLQKAEARFEVNTMGKQYDFDFSQPPILHFSKHIETIEWPIKAI